MYFYIKYCFPNYETCIFILSIVFQEGQITTINLVSSVSPWGRDRHKKQSDLDNGMW